MLKDHNPYQRLISDSINDTDREWLVMLDETLGPVDLRLMEKLGFAEPRELRGLIALKRRYTDGPN